ncbi:hypothetical protein WR25_22183 [Diploscapter pachys]|uniref:Uncharacterized protein n=1 Tax=Diploscapter pachys TaxID=2018661 RepID=A0A2A2K9Z5_9BILA|nr:hypothetical protein WR25_22183 [Diploscapter pachys]
MIDDLIDQSISAAAQLDLVAVRETVQTLLANGVAELLPFLECARIEIEVIGHPALPSPSAARPGVRVPWRAVLRPLRLQGGRSRGAPFEPPRPRTTLPVLHLHTGNQPLTQYLGPAHAHRQPVLGAVHAFPIAELATIQAGAAARPVCQPLGAGLGADIQRVLQPATATGLAQGGGAAEQLVVHRRQQVIANLFLVGRGDLPLPEAPGVPGWMEGDRRQARCLPGCFPGRGPVPQ